MTTEPLRVRMVRIEAEKKVPLQGAPGAVRAEGAASADAGSETQGAPPKAAPALSPEEQMALFEKELKENDWGHQPC